MEAVSEAYRACEQIRPLKLSIFLAVQNWISVLPN